MRVRVRRSGEVSRAESESLCACQALQVQGAQENAGAGDTGAGRHSARSAAAECERKTLVLYAAASRLAGDKGRLTTAKDRQLLSACGVTRSGAQTWLKEAVCPPWLGTSGERRRGEAQGILKGVNCSFQRYANVERSRGTRTVLRDMRDLIARTVTPSLPPYA